jgi:membrane-associated protein
LVIFVETGVVVMPLLPGDSSFCSGFNCFNYRANRYLYRNSFVILAALLGDNVNYFIGKKFGDFIQSKEKFYFERNLTSKKLKNILQKMAVKRSFWRDLFLL